MSIAGRLIKKLHEDYYNVRKVDNHHTMPRSFSALRDDVAPLLEPFDSMYSKYTNLFISALEDYHLDTNTEVVFRGKRVEDKFKYVLNIWVPLEIPGRNPKELAGQEILEPIMNNIIKKMGFNTSDIEISKNRWGSVDGFFFAKELVPGDSFMSVQLGNNLSVMYNVVIPGVVKPSKSKRV